MHYLSLDFDVKHPYFGFSNGLYYESNRAFNDGIIISYSDEIVSELCYDVKTPVIDPPPFIGYDCRCRPWY